MWESFHNRGAPAGAAALLWRVEILYHHLMMTIQAFIAIAGIAASLAAFYVAWRADRRAYKGGFDEELVQRFVASAPVHRIEAITTK